jgi:cell division protease FtsH
MQAPRRDAPRRSGIGLLWWAVLLALLIWTILGLLPTSRPEVAIPYTTFLEQVRGGNVAAVNISGGQITGSFVQPFPYPQPATAAPTSAGATPLPTGSRVATTTPAAVNYSAFLTNFPQTVGDPSLMPLLEAQRVQVTVAPPPNPLLGTLLSTGLPLVLLLAVVVWMGRQASRAQTGALTFSRSKARLYGGEHSQVTLADVAGEEEAKQDLQEVVDFLSHPSKYHDLGARIPRGVLLVGPPGTGKTLLARAVAGEAQVPFFSISASEFVEMFVGVGASRVRDLFSKAKEAAPSIVFIDELDAVGRRRGAGVGNTNDEREQTLNQLLVEMDGFDEHQEVIVLAATNRPDVLDPALQRPGRFDREVVVGLPDRNGREGILRIHTKHIPLAADVDLGLLSRGTTGFSGADLANLANEAALTAARHSHTEVTRADFEEATDRVVLGGARALLLDPKERQVIAYHESGHALVAWLTPNTDPVHKVTIIPHGRALGMTQQLPGQDQYNYSRTYLMARIAVMLGGRTSEELVFGDTTTGAENDLAEATRLARRMVTRWGMGSLGLMSLETDEQQPFLGFELAQGKAYSEDTAALMDRNVRALLEDQHQAAHVILSGSRDKLDQLVAALLHDETVGEERLAEILGPRAEPVAAGWDQAATLSLPDDRPPTNEPR